MVTTRRNYAVNAQPSNSSAYSYSVAGEVSTRTLVTGAADGPLPWVTRYVRSTVTTPKTTGTSGFYSYNQAPVNPSIGALGQVAIYLRSSVTLGGVALTAAWRTAASTQVGGVANSPTVTLPAGQWVRLVAPQLAAPATAVHLGWWATISGGSVLPAGATLDVTGVDVEMDVLVGAHLDGDRPADVDLTASWVGAPYASASITSPTPGLRVERAGTPAPSVGVTLTGLSSSGPSVVTVWQSTSGGTRRAVRGWKKRTVYGSDYYIDYEAPLGREIAYSLEVHSGATIPVRTSDTITLDSATGYIQDPLMPLGTVPISGTRDDGVPTMRGSAFAALQYGVESTQAVVLGRREPVAMTGQRLAMSGMSFDMLTRAAEQATALRNLLAETSLVLVRPLPEWGPLPDLIYTVPSVVEQPIDVAWGGSLTRWLLQGDAVAAPSMQVLVALWTYDQVAALWATYVQAQAAAVASGATYLDNQRDPRMGA